MAPLVLKLHTVSNIFKDLNVDPDELHDTWRVCTKAKKALEHGSRLENISWRRWFLHVKKQTHCSSHSPQDNLTTTTTTTTTTATTTALTLLERQYKRNLLVQQQKQCQQMLEATATKPAVFVDNQYQPPPTISTSVCSTTSSSSGILTVSTMEEDEPLTTCLSDSFPPLDSAPFDDDLLESHPAMYVASDEQPPSLSLLHQQGASSPFSMVTPMHPISNIASSASASPLASYLTTTTTKHHNNNIRIKKKAKKHRVRCPLPVINANANGVSVCDDCGTCSTPLWRRYQNKNLCNACGLYWKLHNSPRPIHLIPSITDPNNQLPQCTNCGTMTTPLWRRHEIDGSPLCNACGLYAKLHQETRPLSMKTNVIKKRQRLS